jgi:hypothetical protein
VWSALVAITLQEDLLDTETSSQVAVAVEMVTLQPLAVAVLDKQPVQVDKVLQGIQESPAAQVSL